MDGEGKIQRERLEGAAQHLSLYFKIQHRHSDHMITYFLGCFAQFHFFSYLDSSLRIHPYLFLCLIDRFACAYFPKLVVLYMDRRFVQIPLALQCCSNGKCAYARRSHPGGFTFSTTALSGQQSHKKVE